MMHRKKHTDNEDISHLAEAFKDDGGSAKQKSTHMSIFLLARAVLSSAFAFSKKSISGLDCFLPGIPTAFKLILLSFLGFAMLVVFTAKGRHEHWRYRHGMRAPQMPVPLIKRLHRNNTGRSNNEERNRFDENNEKVPSRVKPQILAQSSRFVDSEKKLKHQLKILLEKQNTEKNQKTDNPDNSMLGVKISNRYLGDDLLPYPKSKNAEQEWERQMELRKADLSKLDAQEWNEVLDQYDQAMKSYLQHEEDAGRMSRGSNHIINERINNSVGYEKNSGENESMQPLSRWPPPDKKAGPDATILLKPAFGVHRSYRDAIFAFAEGYDLSVYLALVESLINTGYSGDLVLSISLEENLKPDVKEYLESKNTDTSGINVIAYEVNWSCFKQSGEPADGSGEGMNHCKMNDVFGDANGKPISDPRDPRPVATARYELYWMWSLQYNKESWIMLIDARDVWFQLHPFEKLSTRGKVTGELHLFGENANAVKIGTSTFNRSWLVTAYGEKVVLPYFEQPVICSGSTIGNQDAIETYLRAMVSEFDATLCKSKGCDQGFHNYLFYSGKLVPTGGGNALEGISKVFVHDQGRGIINNLAALRTKPLSEWGLYNVKTELVLNWDGTTSVVAHQYDRDKQVNAMVKKKKREFESRWKDIKKLAKGMQ